MNNVVVFVPYGSRLGFHMNDVAATMSHIDYKFPQCICYEEEHEHGTCYAIEGNVVDRVSAKNGKGWCENVSPTLNTQDRHAVVFALEGNGARPSHLGKGFSDDGTMYTLNTIEQHSVCYSVDCRNLCMNTEKSGTIQAKNVGGFSYNYLNPILMEKDT